MRGRSRPSAAASLAAALLLVLAAAGAAAPREPTPIRDTGVRLVVPDGFRVAGDFPGIGRAEDLTSLLVTELPVPLEVSRRDFDAEGLGERGIRVSHIVPVEVDGRTGWLAHASQSAAGVVFRKWILLTGDDTRSVMLTATTPLDLEAVHQRALVETLRGARWTPEPESAEPAPLPFRIDPVGPLRILRSSPNAVVLSDPSSPGDGRLPPLVSVGVSQARVQIRDLPEFARRRLRESASLERIEIEAETPRGLDGMPGHEIRARAHDAASGRPVAVTQLLATDGARYFLVQAVVEPTAAPGFEALWQPLLDGFQRTDRR